MLNIQIQPIGLLVNGTLLDAAPSVAQISEALREKPTREKEMDNQGRSWRKFVIFDEAGFYLLYDYEVERTLDIHFSFELSKNPAYPKNVFSGLLFINQTRLVPRMAESMLPLKGEFQFIKRGGWEASSDSVFVNLRVIPSRKKLEAVSVTFLNRPAFGCEE